LFIISSLQCQTRFDWGSSGLLQRGGACDSTFKT